jgi:hypothetical protein
MNLTLEEVKERLATLDETTLIEELDIRSQDIVNRFDDIIEEQMDRLIELIEWEEDIDE